MVELYDLWPTSREEDRAYYLEPCRHVNRDAATVDTTYGVSAGKAAVYIEIIDNADNKQPTN